MQTQLLDSGYFILESVKPYLRKLGRDRGLFVVVPEKCTDGSLIVLSSAAKTMEMRIVGPERLGTIGRTDGIWALRVGYDLLGFWPAEGWKVRRPMMINWEKVNDFEVYMERRLSEWFGARVCGTPSLC